MLNTSQTRFDVITLGETMLRFTPPAYERFGQSRSVEVHVGGSESNTAVGLARLGHRVCWLSRLTDNPLGRWIVSEIAAQGVDVSHVVWTNDQRVGTYYMERGSQPRASQIFYDRGDSAMSCMQPDELPVEIFDASAAKIFHLSGITCGISRAAAQTASRAVELAQQAGQRVSFDLNYRGRLWAADEAYRSCAPLMAQSDFIFLPIRDAYAVCGVPSRLDAQSVCRELHERWPNATIILTLGSQGALAMDASGASCAQPAYAVNAVERLGTGDAFSAGYLSSVLQGDDIATSLAWACSAAAIKYTLPGDLPLFDRAMLSKVQHGDSQPPGQVQR